MSLYPHNNYNPLCRLEIIQGKRQAFSKTSVIKLDNFYNSRLLFHHFLKTSGSKRVHGNTTHLV